MNSELLSAFFNENLWTRFNVARIFEVCWHNVDDCYSCTANASHNSWIDQCIKVHPYNLFLKKRGKKNVHKPRIRECTSLNVPKNSHPLLQILNTQLWSILYSQFVTLFSPEFFESTLIKSFTKIMNLESKFFLNSHYK